MLRGLSPYGLNGFATFAPALKIVLKNEGGYANKPLDKGGETYRGIARNFHGYWQGWIIIDFYKSRFGAIPEGAYITELMPEYSHIDTDLVPDFYASLWQKSRAGEIASQAVANLYFDFFVHSQNAVSVVQQTLNSFGHKLAVDNAIGPNTLAAINATDANELHDAIKQNRIGYIDQLVKNGSLDPSFYEGIQKRIAGFPQFTTDRGTNKALVVFFLFATAGAALLLRENLGQKLKNKDYEK
ncbi:glycosyl hydrolase 108 family protein [Roseivirga seohaensis]|uniref:glycosyl hydrolase 108 family protein n=1 Tax=Roseivirga seohaensis TaxID=1914963 RepID=UPI003BAD1EA9